MAYNSLIIKKIFDYIDSKLVKLKSVLDFGDQDLNISYEMTNYFKENNIDFLEKNLTL